ncbi:MAG: amidohydrolase family protein, partial [Caldithrix sp.]|nr:amidohydrolase family protein [Caldithrix sp.]
MFHLFLYYIVQCLIPIPKKAYERIIHKMKVFLIYAVSILLLLSCGSSEQKADLIITNGKVITVDLQNPRAQAVAVKSDTILAVGSVREIAQLEGTATEVIDASGKRVMPGFIESHAHFLSLGEARMKLELRSAETWAAVIDKVAEAVQDAQPGQWILGRGWHQEKWAKLPAKTVEGYPVHDALSAASPDNPVMLSHASGHALFANQKAMEIAGVNAAAKEPAGGRILRFKDGRPTGVFLENAEKLVTSAYNKWNAKRSAEERAEDKRKAALTAVQACVENGITTFHDAGASFEDIDLFKQLIDENVLNVRLWVMLYESNEAIKTNIEGYRIKNYGDKRLTVGGIKRYMDGALGARGAWLLKPYSDLPSEQGLNTID